MFSGTLNRVRREVGNFNPMQLLEINLIVLVLVLLPSNPFHRGPDGARSPEKSARRVQAAVDTAAPGRLTYPAVLPELIGKLAFFHSRFISS